jgi:hypothetical protein
MKCQHDLSEQETAVADGQCAICGSAETERLRAALKAIRVKRYDSRDGGTFTPDTAWSVAQKLNKAICEIFEIAKNALEPK